MFATMSDPAAETHASLTCQPLLGQPPFPGLPSMRPKGVLLTQPRRSATHSDDFCADGQKVLEMLLFCALRVTGSLRPHFRQGVRTLF